MNHRKRIDLPVIRSNWYLSSEIVNGRVLHGACADALCKFSRLESSICITASPQDYTVLTVTLYIRASSGHSVPLRVDDVEYQFSNGNWSENAEELESRRFQEVWSVPLSASSVVYSLRDSSFAHGLFDALSKRRTNAEMRLGFLRTHGNPHSDQSKYIFIRLEGFKETWDALRIHMHGAFNLILKQDETDISESDAQ